MGKRLKKIAVITGATGDLAPSVIRAFKDPPWQLALFGRSPQGCDRLRRDYSEALVVSVDLADPEQAQQAVANVLEHYGRIDAALNLAGGFAVQSGLEMTPEDLDKQLTINLKTLVNTTRAVLPGMLERGSGFILGVAAGQALNGGAKAGAYAAAKAAVTGYLKSVRAEVEAKGVGVTLLYPMGTIDTPSNRKVMPKGDPDTWIDPDDIAASMLHAATRSRRGQLRELRIFPPR